MKKFLGVLLIVIFLAFFGIKFLFFPAKNHDAEAISPKGAPKGPLELNLTALVIKEETLDNTLNSSGSLKANEEVEIQPEVSGKITELLFHEGSNVKKGQLLFKLNDLDLKATLKKLEFNLQLAIENEQRQAQLLKINGISQQDYDVSKNTVDATKADIEFTKAAISKTQVLAPFDGRIGLRYVSVGSFVTQTSKIATIQQIDPLKLDFSIPEQYASLVKIGDKINFKVQGVNDPFSAVVEAIEPRIDVNTRTLSLRALYRNTKDRFLLPGTFANVSLVLHSTSKALMVPTECLVPVLKGQTLFRYHLGKATQIPVQTGVRTDTKVEITNGIAVGDTIISTGLLSLKPEQEVKPPKIS
jgi:membrane fusion protein (multidrug efflux system)